jgi:hypothetical protein
VERDVVLSPAQRESLPADPPATVAQLERAAAAFDSLASNAENDRLT